MLKFIANLFGVKTKAPTAPAPYKVEAVTPKVEPLPVSETSKPATKTKKAGTAKPAKITAEKKPVAKPKTARKPRAPKA